MQKTIDDFSSYYSTTKKQEKFFPKEILEKYVLEIFHSKIILNNTFIQLDIEDQLQLNCYEHIFSNILMILIDNSLDSFQSNDQGNHIKISIYKQNNYYKINYSDNAGGIQIQPIEKIFEYFVTSKEYNDTQSHGMGLAIAKMLVEDRLNGKISVETKDKDVLFQIVFPA